jgi:hypothetical protein
MWARTPLTIAKNELARMKRKYLYLVYDGSDDSDDSDESDQKEQLRAVVEMLEAWRALTEDQRRVIIQYGRPYSEMPRWREGRHHEYPEHLRGQAVALVLCSQLGSRRFPPGRELLSLLVGAVEAWGWQSRRWPHGLPPRAPKQH